MKNVEEALKDYVFQNDNGHIVLTLNQIEKLHKQNYNPKELWEKFKNWDVNIFFKNIVILHKSGLIMFAALSKNT